MANIEVTVQANLLDKPVKIRALVANNSPKTQISRRLANKLGLLEAKDVYVKDALEMFAGHESIRRWKLSLKPLTIVCNEGME